MKANKPTSPKRLHDGHFEVDGSVLFSAFIKLLLNLISIPLLEFTAHEFLCCFVDSEVHWLQAVCAIGRDFDDQDVAHLQHGEDLLCHLTLENIEDSQYRVLRRKLEFQPLAFNIRYYNVLYVFFVLSSLDQ